MVAPTTRFGLAYYLTEGLSLRPWLGLGYSSSNGLFADVGAQLSFEPAPAGTWSPFASVTAQYSHSGNAAAMPAGTPRGPAYQAGALQSDLGQFGAGAGLRCRLSGSLAVFAEGRVAYATSPAGYLDTGRSSVAINDRTRAEAVLGLTYLFR